MMHLSFHVRMEERNWKRNDYWYYYSYCYTHQLHFLVTVVDVHVCRRCVAALLN